MNRLREGFRLIPWPARIVAALVYACFVVLSLAVLIPSDPKLRHWLPWQKELFAFSIPILLVIFVLLIGYVYADAKRRGMRYVMWTLLATFVPNAIGIILYFLLRDPLPAPCPSCGVLVRGTFTFCPHCGSALRPSCPHCGRAVERGWANCAYCGMRLRSP